MELQTPIKAVIVDGDLSARMELKLLLGGVPAVECVGEFASAAEALTQMPRRQPTLFFIEIIMLGLTGFECVRRLRAILPRAKIIMSTRICDAGAVLAAQAAGAAGYMVKPLSPAIIATAIQSVFLGKYFISREITRFSSEPLICVALELAFPGFLTRYALSRWKQFLDVPGYWVKLAKDAQFRVDKLSRAYGLSIRQLEREWRSCFGMLPSLWLHRIQMALAFSLRQEGIPSKSICDEVGIKDVHNLYRKYKTYFQTHGHETHF